MRKLCFIHNDGRRQYVETPDELRQFGGIPNFVCAATGVAADIIGLRQIEIWVTWINNPVPAPSSPETVLIVVGDERARVPPRSSEFLCCFRTGSQRIGDISFLSRDYSSWRNFLEATRAARNIALRVSDAFKRGSSPLPPGHIYSLPIGDALGLSSSADGHRPLPMMQRRWDVSFVGSVGPYVEARRLNGLRVPVTPKSSARLSALRGVEAIVKDSPGVSTFVRCSDVAGYGGTLDGDAYARTISDTKISLCPRGNFPETFRLFESAYYGCVILSDKVGKEWYFEGNPFIHVPDWNRISETVVGLLSDPVQLERLGNATRSWWLERASEQAVGQFIAKTVQDHVDQRAAR